MFLLVWLSAALCLVEAAAGGAVRAGDVRLWARGGALRYRLESAALLNEAARRDGEVGWRLVGTLAVRPLACAPDEALLEFQLESVELTLRGAHPNDEWVPRPSVWDAPAARAAFYAHWRAGAVRRALLPAAPSDVSGFQRGLLSLFQFQIIDGERNETDVSGECAVLYETTGELDFRKYKRVCAGDEGSGVVSRRLARYSLTPALDAVRALHAEELHTLRAAGAGEGAWDAAVKVRAWARLELQEDARAPAPAAPPAPPSPPAAPLQGELDRLLARPELADVPLATPANEEEANESTPDSLEAAVEAAVSLESWAAGAGGGVRGAAAGLRALAALRGAAAPALRRLLASEKDPQRLTELARLLGATGTEAAFVAAKDALGLAREPLLEPALAYLGAAGAAGGGAARGLLALAAEGGQGGAASGRVRAAALLAAAAAAAHTPHEAAARDFIVKHLQRCKDGECQSIALLALGNLRRADTAALLLEHAERLAAPRALDALRALQLSPPSALAGPALYRLADVALNTSRPLPVRGAALELAVRHSAAAPLWLAGAARRLAAERGAAAGELRRALWQRLAALAPRHAPVRDLLRAARADPELGNWHAMAHAGTTSVLVREAGWGADEWWAELDSVQLARGGLLQRGEVGLSLRGPGGVQPVLGVELWTRGLAALAGGEGGEGGAEEEGDAAAGLLLTVRGVRLPPITLFEGQTELLGLVWAGAGSEPTPVLRALLALPARAARVRLQTGGRAGLRAAAAAALALDARAAVSLWARTAAAELELRAALYGEAGASLSTAWGELGVNATAAADAAFSIAADLDFYDAVAVCVRARLAPHAQWRNATLQSLQGARRWRVSRRRTLRAPRAGRTLALGRPNDAACRTLAPRDD